MNRGKVLANIKKLKTDVVPVPEWDDEITIRELSADKAMELGVIVKKDDKQAMVLWVIAAAIDDETGQPMFQDTPEDRAMLGDASAAAILRIGNAAIALSGIGEAVQKETTKN